MRGRAVTVAMVLAMGALAGCGDSPPPPGVVEIGVRGAEGEFVRLKDGDTLQVVMGAGGAHYVEPSLRARTADLHQLDPTVTVTVEGLVLAVDLMGRYLPMESDGVGYVLWDVPVEFQTALCCFVCRDGLVEAQLADDSGGRSRGQVSVLLTSGGCPDLEPWECCERADMCPDPSMTQLCE